MEQQTVTSAKINGPSRAEVLTTIFVVLKLCKLIDWSWLWVLSPLWLTLIMSILVVLINMLNEYMEEGR